MHYVPGSSKKAIPDGPSGPPTHKRNALITGTRWGPGAASDLRQENYNHERREATAGPCCHAKLSAVLNPCVSVFSFHSSCWRPLLFTVKKKMIFTMPVIAGAAILVVAFVAGAAAVLGPAGGCKPMKR